MGKGASAKAEVTEYRMSVHLGVSLPLDSISRILIDEKVAYQGSVTSNTVLTINKPDLFGGEKKEGGAVGAIEVMLGGDDQVASAQLAGRYGLTPSTCPGFRGYTSLFFRGSGQVRSGPFNDFLFFDSNWAGVGGNGFLWKHNSPFIAQKIEVEGSCAPKTSLNQAYATIQNPDHASRPDANPAHMIWEACVSDYPGMGLDESQMDRASFEAAALSLFNEDFGLSILWTESTEVKAIIDEILQHIQGTIFTDPETGKITLKLHRFDYDIGSLPAITPDNAKMGKWRVRSGGEIVNEITVDWTNPETEKSESITGQVIASIDAQGGKKVASTRNYYGARHAGLARTLLARDLRESTAPLATCEVTVDRSAWNLKPGSVVKLQWPRRSPYDRIMRVGKINYGQPGASQIRISLVEDVFSLALPPVAIDPGSGWVDPSAEPAPLTMQLTTLPSYFTRNGALQDALVDLERPEVLVMSLADSQDDDSLNYELVGETSDGVGGTGVQSRGTMSMTPLSYLTTTLNAAATSELPAALFPDINWGPTIGGFVLLGYADANQEMALVTGRTSTGWTLSRGALDTIPRTWASTTPIWCINPGARIVDTLMPQAGGAVVTYRGLDRTSLGLLAYAAASDETVTLTERPWLPLRPANVAVNGTAFGSLNVSAAPTVEITWATRNRLLEDSQPLAWTEGSVAPEYRQETIVRVYNVATGLLVAEYPWLWLDTSISFPKTAFDRYASVRIEVTSRRDDLEALQAHSVTLTGLANNPAAPLPPAPAARTTPPPVFAAPAINAFAAVAGTAEGPDGSAVPTIVVSGTQDDLDADHLVIRYKVAGTATWRVLPSVALNGEAVSVELPGLQPTTTYDIEVGYLFGGQPGIFRTLADVTTGSIVSGETVPVVPGNISGTPTLSIASSLGSDGTVRVLAAGDWADAANAIAYVVELDDGVAVRTVEFAESKFSEIPAIVGRTYRHRAKGKSGTGHLSAAWSSWSASVAAGGDDTAPGAPTAGSAVARGFRNLVSWVPATAADYRGLILWRTTTSTPPTLASTPYAPIVQGSNFIDDAVTPGQQYWYWGASVDYSGNPSAITAIGNCTARFVNVDGGDVSPTDSTLVTALNPDLITVSTGDGVALPMYLSGSDTATFVGNKYTRTSGANNFNQMGISRQGISGPAQVSGTLLDPFTGFGFTQLSALVSQANTSCLAQWYRSSVDWRVMSGNTTLLNCGAALNGVTFSPTTVFAVTDDCITQRWWADGIEMYSRPTPSGSIIRRAACFAYPGNRSVGGLKLEPFNNAQWSAVLGTGRPDDNASRADNYIVNATLERGLENYNIAAAALATTSLNGRWLRNTGTTGTPTVQLNTVQGSAIPVPDPMWPKLPEEAIAYLSYDKRSDGARRTRLLVRFYNSAGAWNGVNNLILDNSANTSGATTRVNGTITVPVGYPHMGVTVHFGTPFEGTYVELTNFRLALTEEAANVTETRTAAFVDGQGELATQDALHWDGPQILSRPVWATDGRVAAGFDAAGNIIRPVPLDVIGASGLVRFDQLTLADGADTIGWRPTGGTVTDTVANILDRGAVYPEQYGAVGDGVADDTTALQAALDTGRAVYLTRGKTYLYNINLVITANHQYFGGEGILKPVGNFNTVIVAGGCVGVTLDLIFSSSGHTGGYAVAILNANRVRIRKLHGLDIFGGLYVEKCNVCMVEWMWAICRGPGIKWYGNGTKRSDILSLNRTYIGMYGAGEYGLDWDGNCHTLILNEFGIVNSGGTSKGIRVRNTSGATAPAIGRFNMLQLDYMSGDAVDFQVPISDIDFISPYIFGSTGGSGVKIAAGTNTGEVRINGGKIRANSRYGVENLSAGAVYLDGAIDTFSNTLGPFLGDVRTVTPRLHIDDSYYATMSGANPLLGFDANDFIAYDRAGNSLNFNIGTNVASLTATVFSHVAKVAAPTFEMDATGSLALSVGSVVLGFDANDYLGYSRSGNTLIMVIGGTTRFSVTSALFDTSLTFRSPRLEIDGNAYLTVSTGSVIVGFDANDYLSYDRALNQLNLVIGGVGRLTASSTLIESTVEVRSTRLSIDAEAYFTLNSGNTLIGLAANDYINFERAANRLSFVIGGVEKFAADTNGMLAERFSVDGAGYLTLSSGNVILGFDANDYLGYDRALNSMILYVAGAAALTVTAGSLAHPVKVASPTFELDATGYTSLSAGVITQAFDANDFWSYDRATNVLGLNIGGVGRLTVSATAMVSTVDFSAPRLSVDAQAYLTLSSTNPLMSVDANDYWVYDRTANRWGFYIGGTERLGLTSTALESARFQIDANAWWTLASTNPKINFDTNDYVQYDRTANTFEVVIGTVQRWMVDATGAKSTSFRVDDTFLTSIVSTKPRQAFDTNDFVEYDRTANAWAWAIGGTTRLSLAATGLTSGQGFFVDANLSLALSGSNPTITLDTNDYVSFDRASNLVSVVIGGSARLTVSSTGTITATLFSGSGANLTNLNADSLATGTVPSGRLTGTYSISISGSAAQLDGKAPATAATVNTVAVRDASGHLFATRFAVDANFYSHILSLNPTTVYDTNDYFAFDRAGNRASFYIGGTERLGITTLGMETARLNIDAGLYLTLSGGNPLFVFDADDFLAYDRTSNSLNLTIDGVTPVSFGKDKITFGAIAKLTARTVTSLPTGELGMIACVNDATAPTVGATVAGGGAANALIFHNGTDWKVVSI